MTSFNLTREPWIPVEGLDGRLFELSTRDTLSSAHVLRGLTDPSPLIIAALTRHLLAVLHRAYAGPRTMKEWCAIASSGAFDPMRVDAYLDRVEDRMDLFHPTQPFAQTRGMLDRFGVYRPIDELEVLRASWGSARELFRHRPPEPKPEAPAARAARALLSHQAFAEQGTAVRKQNEPLSASAAPLRHSGVIVLRGRTLFLTLISNLLVYDPAHGRPMVTGGATDACSWELAAQPPTLQQTHEPKRRPFGYLDLLTWLSRRVELVHENGVVAGFINAAGMGVEPGSPLDPMVAYRRHKKYGWLPIGIDSSRAFWRSANALFEVTRGEEAAFDRPRAIDLVSDPSAIDLLGRDTMYDIEVLGIAADKQKTTVDAIRFERVASRARCFNDVAAGEAVRECLDLSEELVDALTSSLYTYARSALAPGERQPDPKDVRSLVSSLGAEPAAWSAFGVIFDGFLRTLGDDPDAAAAVFRSETTAIVKDLFRSATARPSTTGRWLKARALAEQGFHFKLASLTEGWPSQDVREVSLNG